METICKDTKLSVEQIESAKRKVLDDIGLHNYCCRARMMGYVKLIDEIV